MCGILFSLTSRDSPIDSTVWQSLIDLNTKRGPDSQTTREAHVGQDQNLVAHFFSSVLHLRGKSNVVQPLASKSTGDILCWNGEVFDGLPMSTEENDTQVLFGQLEEADDILKVISRVEGPFAFVFWQQRTNTIWFGRDCLGRRSLLWRRTASSLLICSTAQRWDSEQERSLWEEIPANGIYGIHLDGSSGKEPVFNVDNHPVCLYPWISPDDDHDKLDLDSSLVLAFPKLNRAIPSKPIAEQLLEPDLEYISAMHNHVKAFQKVLDEAVRVRVADIPFHSVDHDQPRVAILFSGGLDCICLAALADKHLPIHEPIDLLNVAFENPRSQNAKKNKQSNPSCQQSTYDTPDRITGREGVKELRLISPKRQWNFVEINVPYNEAMAHRQEIIDRMFPLDTVMDLSIAMALWFAARGKGEINLDDSVKPYHSHARVLISGLGADEQLGGYSRHREAFRRGGWEQLIDEASFNMKTQLDVDRISTRNLGKASFWVSKVYLQLTLTYATSFTGRDDRIISDHGKEARFPYLSTHVVNHLCQLPIDIKMDMRYGRGFGEKLLLRQVAVDLGLSKASRNWKRAIQFGAKTAKMTGDRRSEKGQHKLEN
ncbi:hypothetical protein LRAMOSA08083 [Lichtheimia ramosa]|uniref:Glutamine amidotransferase type-2 domain-containing protein n=1 Tax=Lichtheimia ramosa TaxID=688394 RepID=A0A077WDU6_9FUNG|nr:hypothetical protein LRAMOSA08083 [Lichtheimia ramosa]